MVDDGRARGEELSGEIQRAAAGLGEDAVAGTVDDIRGEREGPRAIDMGDELGIGGGVAPDGASGDRIRAVALEDQTSGSEGQRVAGSDGEALPCPARLQLHLIYGPGTRQAVVVRDARSDRRDA